MAYIDRTPTPDEAAELEHRKAQVRKDALDRAAKRVPQKGRKRGLGLTRRLDPIEQMERE